MDKEYWTFKQICESKRFPFTKGQLSKLAMDRAKNGLDKCIFKVGKKLIFRIDLFEKWIESHTNGK